MLGYLNTTEDPGNSISDALSCTRHLFIVIVLFRRASDIGAATDMPPNPSINAPGISYVPFTPRKKSFKLPFKTTLSNKSSLYNTIQVNTYYQCAKIV